MLKRNKMFVCFFFWLIVIINVYSQSSVESNVFFYPVDKIINFLNPAIEFDHLSGEMVITKNNIKATLTMFSPYMIIKDNFYYMYDFAITDQGTFAVPIGAAVKLLQTFSQKNDTFVAKQNKIYYNDKEISQMETSTDGDIIAEIIFESENKSVNNENENQYKAYVFEDEPDHILINAIVIDAGHGGKDSGCYKYDVKEKDVVLKTALMVEEILKKRYKEKKIFMTRSGDTFVPLDKRADFANNIFERYGASVFVSIHANATVSDKPYGFETWYIVDEYQKQIIKEGAVSDDRDVETVLNSMLNDEIYKESRDLAIKIQNNLEKNIGYVSKNRGVKESTYIVIKKPVIPAVLVEIGFLSNKYEANRLTNDTYLAKIATGISDGIDEFIREYEMTKGFTR